MDINKFPNPKLNLTLYLKNLKEKEYIFMYTDQYLNLVKDFIFTEIDLNYLDTSPERVHAWLQRIISSSLFRSLYIRNSFVDCFNARNLVGMMLPLKAWFEIVGFLASILNLLKRKISEEELYEELLPYCLGNKGKGNMRIGTVEAKSVAKMMEEANKYIKNLQSKNTKSETFFTDFYDVASNPTHPSFDAHEIISGLGDPGIFRIKNTNQIKSQIDESLPMYGGLMLSSIHIRHICQKIFAIEKEHFSKLNSQKYFQN